MIARHMLPRRTRWLPLAVGALLSGVCSAQAPSGRWPARVPRIVVATAPGGGDDYSSRVLAAKLSDVFHQQFIVENRPGAGGLLAQAYVAKAPADGYTWLLAGGTMAGARFVNAAATYDVLRDFSPVSLVETSQFVMVVHPTVPARTPKEYIALARSQPGKMTFGTLGAGQVPYWSAVLFNTMAGVRAVEVPYTRALAKS